MPLHEMATERWSDPDQLYGVVRRNKAYDRRLPLTAVAFVVIDANQDGIYDTVLRGQGNEAVHRKIVRYKRHWELIKQLPQGSLPPICGRTLISPDHHLVAFWPTTRYQLLTEGGRYIFGKGHFNNDIDLHQYLGSQILPLLLQKKLVTQDTIVFDHFGHNMSLKRSRKPEDRPTQSDIELLESLGVPVVLDSDRTQFPQDSDATTSLRGEEIYNVGGQNYTFMELLAILHAGNASERSQAMAFICSQSGGRFDQVKQRLNCQQSTQKKVWTEPRNVQVGEHGVDFRSQRSLNRAWEAEMAKRFSRRRRLARILVQGIV